MLCPDEGRLFLGKCELRRDWGGRARKVWQKSGRMARCLRLRGWHPLWGAAARGGRLDRWQRHLLRGAMPGSGSRRNPARGGGTLWEVAAARLRRGDVEKRRRLSTV